MICELKKSNNGSLSGFEVYVTSGWGWTGRILWTLLYPVASCISVYSTSQNVCISAIVTILILLVSAYFYFGPLCSGYRIISSHFGKGPQVIFLKGPLFKRVEVTVDASKSKQENPKIETADSSEMKQIYKSRKGHWFFMPIKRASVAQAEAEKSKSLEKKTGSN